MRAGPDPAHWVCQWWWGGRVMGRERDGARSVHHATPAQVVVRWLALPGSVRLLHSNR